MNQITGTIINLFISCGIIKLFINHPLLFRSAFTANLMRRETFTYFDYSTLEKRIIIVTFLEYSFKARNFLSPQQTVQIHGI